MEKDWQAKGRTQGGSFLRRPRSIRSCRTHRPVHAVPLGFEFNSSVSQSSLLDAGPGGAALSDVFLVPLATTTPRSGKNGLCSACCQLGLAHLVHPRTSSRCPSDVRRTRALSWHHEQCSYHPVAVDGA